MRLPSRPFSVLALVFCGVLTSQPASGQYFGRNKVEYVDFAFKVIDTEHFTVYHYPSEEPAAQMAARLAERWYTRLSRALQHELTGRQPLIVYGSQPEFAQTNVVSGFLGEGIGGVTEGLRRRIVMPFAPTLAETDRVLGHEIVHAFQFDLIRRYRTTAPPRWAVEGMAQYLSLGNRDGQTAMWVRDAIDHDLLPDRQKVAAARFSPYSFGHAFWAYVGGRFGANALADLFKVKRPRTFAARVTAVTGMTLAEIFEAWRQAETDARGDAPTRPPSASSVLVRGKAQAKLSVGPALSPDGRSAAFFAEQDRLSIDLLLTDTETGSSQRRLATRLATPRFDSLQWIRSTGAWDFAGERFAFSAVQHGRASIIVLDMKRRTRDREIPFPQFGQILSPSFSPDGRTLVFSAIEGGFNDLFLYDLDAGSLARLTHDPFADLQPVFSPDGRRIAFATDRFTSDLDDLDFGPCELATMEVSTRSIVRASAFPGRRQVNPQWSVDGTSLFFASAPRGISNIFRLELASGAVYQITDERGGVTGLTATSPALSVARHARTVAYTTYRAGRYEIDLLKGDEALEGRLFTNAFDAASTRLAPRERSDGLLMSLLQDVSSGLPQARPIEARPYTPKLSLESVGQPQLSSGSSRLGSFVRGGGSLLFGDMLGERKLAMALQVGNHLRDFALETRFINRSSRWNRGVLLELMPSVYGLSRRRVIEADGEPALAREIDYLQRIQVRFGGVLSYPFSDGLRVEFLGGIRHAEYQRGVESQVLSLATRKVLSDESVHGPGGAPTNVGEVGAAMIGDTAVWGPTGPILGGRFRYEVSPTFGDLSFIRVLLDYRRYVMPVKPYTLAFRLLHTGRYGTDADDGRLTPSFLGSRFYVRGYGWNPRHCEWSESGSCVTLEEMLSSRVAVANVELRFPLLGVAHRAIDYGPIPADGFLFADGGMGWSRRVATDQTSARRWISSVGAGVRVNALGWPLELAAVRALDGPMRGWSFDVSFRRGF